MKKLLSLILAAVMLAGMLCACGAKDSDSDLAYVQKKGTLVVGITDYAPMDYKDENGEWTGFDAEFARLFARELDVEVEFFLLSDWSKRFYELETKNIDVIWNGMTINEEVRRNTNCSDPYVLNSQVLVMKAGVVENYRDTDSLKGLAIAVENGSVAQDLLDDLGITGYVLVQDQAAALLEVAAGTSEACVVDITAARAMTGEGTSFDMLAYGMSLSSEEYGVGFRKDSDLTGKLNAFMEIWMQDGTLDALARQYALTLAK